MACNAIDALQVSNSTLEPDASGTLNIFTVVYPGPGFTGKADEKLNNTHSKHMSHNQCAALHETGAMRVAAAIMHSIKGLP